MEITFRPFDGMDWNNYPGAEGEPEIAQVVLPLDGKYHPCEIVLDDNGINLDYWEETLDVIHDFNFALLSGQGKERARHIINLIRLDTPDITADDLMVLGFEYYNSAKDEKRTAKRNTSRIEILNDLKEGDTIRLHPDPEFDETQELDCTFVTYDPEFDILVVRTKEDGVFDVDAEQFKEVLGRVP